MLAACGSGTVTHDRGVDPPSGGSPPGTPPPGGLPPPSTPPAPVTSVTLTGTATFDLVPYSATVGSGLDYAATTAAPARGITLELVNSSSGVVQATTTTDATGTYTFANVQANTIFKLRMKAEIAGVQVLDNTASDALHQYEGPEFSSGAIEPRQMNVNAPSGWDTGSSSYTQPRSAAPFAILDSVYQTQQYVLASVPGLPFPALKYFWSPLNTPTGTLATDRATGGIETTQYVINGTTGQPEIYVLGDANNDTDEYDRDVIIQHWAYYYLDSYSRDDTIVDGEFEDLLDPRNAFSEGFVRALPAMVTGSGRYRDTEGAAQGDETADSEDLETPVITPAGWFNPHSVAAMFNDLVDTNEDGVDLLALPFGALHEAFVDARDTPALTSVYPVLNGLVSRQAAVATQIGDILNQHGILRTPTDDYGTGETNDGGTPGNLPVYAEVTLDGAPVTVTSSGSPTNNYNGLGNRRFVRIALSSATTVTITATATGPGAAGADPDIYVYTLGENVDFSEEGDPTVEELELTLPAGVHIIEVFESANVYFDPGDPPVSTPIQVEVVTS